VNIRRQLYKKYRLEGLSGYKAARQAGYSHATAINAHKNIEKHCDFSQELIKAGLTDDVLSKIAFEGLHANKVISANITYGDADEKTNDFIDVPDWAVRHKYLETILKLQGKLKEKADVEINNYTNIWNGAIGKSNKVDQSGRLINS